MPTCSLKKINFVAFIEYYNTCRDIIVIMRLTEKRPKLMPLKILLQPKPNDVIKYLVS